MDKVESFKIFLEVSKHQSFVAASHKLGISAPAVTRAIAALEKGLGIKLFNRTTRLVRLTEAGKRFAQDTKAILEAIDDAEAAASGSYAEPTGTLNVTAPIQFGEKCVMPIIVEYLHHFPKVSVNALFYDRVTSLVEEEIDVAIRIGHLNNSNLYAKQVGSVRKVICASPAYFQAYSKPETPQELTKHNLILTSASDPQPIWYFENKGKKQSVKFVPKLRCNQIGASLKAAHSGLGIVKLLSYQIATDVAEGSLETALTDYEEPAIPVSIVHLEGRRTNAKIRSFIDFAEVRLKDSPYIN